MTPVRDNSQTGWWYLTQKVVTIVFPFLLSGVTGVSVYALGKIQEGEKDIAVIKSSYQTKDDAAKSFEQLKDLIHGIDVKLSRIIPEGK